MKIWVDADSCPKAVRDMVVKAAMRVKVELFFIANRRFPLSESSGISLILVPSGEGHADTFILERVSFEDLVITRDILFAARLVERKMTVMNDRGILFNPEIIEKKLSQRDYMMMLKEAGLEGEQSRSYGKKEIQAFASTFDMTLTRKLHETGV